MNDLNAEFSTLSFDGCLGDPNGADAYAYLRASSERQVEEGSSFPRQLESIHKAARRDRLRVPYDLIFFDDGYTGFEFEHRPALNSLREEIASKPRANHVIFEDIDRLSRDADWQQGYLLFEFARYNVQPHFFINPGSQLERYVRGYIAQEGMKKDLKRMADGTLRKALAGKVTAKRPRYGYILTDRKDTHYETHPEESKVVRQIYEQIIYQGMTAKAVARWLNDNKVPTRFPGKVWDTSAVCTLIKSTVYKGEFYANRLVQVKTGKYNASGRPGKTTRVRSEDEWVKVSVPAIVTPQEWDQAQACLKKNSVWHLRNGKMRGWLLQGMLKCANCSKFVMRAITRKTNWREEEYRYYICGSKHNERARLAGTRCRVPFVRADQIERRVWEKVEHAIYNPEVIIKRLEERVDAAQMDALKEQVDYITGQLKGLEKEEKKLEAAYNADIYSLEQFKSKMADLKERAKNYEVGKSKVQAQMAEHASIEDQKRVVITALKKLKTEVEQARRDQRLPNEIPFELKRKLLTVLVDVILVDSVKREFTIHGEIKGTYGIDKDPEPDDGNSNGNSRAGIPNTSNRRSQSPIPDRAASRG